MVFKNVCSQKFTAILRKSALLTLCDTGEGVEGGGCMLSTCYCVYVVIRMPSMSSPASSTEFIISRAPKICCTYTLSVFAKLTKHSASFFRLPSIRNRCMTNAFPVAELERNAFDFWFLPRLECRALTFTMMVPEGRKIEEFLLYCSMKSALGLRASTLIFLAGIYFLNENIQF